MPDNDEWFQKTAEFAPVAIAVMDATGSTRYVNGRLAQLTHRPKESLLGPGLTSFLISDEPLLTSIRDLDKTPDEGHRYRCHVDVGTDSPRTVGVALHWLATTDHRPIGAVATIEDITERVAAEHDDPTVGDRDATTSRPVAERFDSLARTAAGIAHEFRDTLIGLLMSVPDSCATVAVDAPAIDPGDMPAPISCDVNSLIRTTVPPLVDQTPSVTLSLLLSEPPTPVCMDPAQLTEALRFLTVNAIEAMPRGGTITVVASGTAQRFGARPDCEFFQLSVMDTRTGITAGSFENPVTPCSATTAGTPWTGLGLAASYDIAERAGGWMAMTSTPDAGATVHMYIPKHVPARRAAPTDNDGIRGSGELLLVVDDDEALRTIARRLLTKAGFEVLTATGGAEALSVMQGRLFDCLVTDIAMPDIGGIDLAEKVGAVEAEMPIVFVSGFVSVSPVGTPLPDNTYSLAKPYTAEALISTICRAIRRGAAGGPGKR